ncbi:MAG: CBS domain-containing protein, partial [Gammaproteobacteria bacterium]
MQTVRDILQYKGDEVWSVEPGDMVLHALGVMAQHDIGAVLVMDGDAVAGILTERDYARKVVLAGRSSRESPIREVMTAEVVCVAP